MGDVGIIVGIGNRKKWDLFVILLLCFDIMTKAIVIK